MRYRLFAWVALASPLACIAQGAPAGAHPADASAAVPALGFASAFTGYRRYEEPKLGSWRELNAQVQSNATARVSDSPAQSSAASAPSATPPSGMSARKPAAQQHQH